MFKKELKDLIQAHNLIVHNRKEVLAVSLIAESLCSNYLGTFLNIKDISKTRTLSNKSSAFSFNQKVSLLMDLDVLASNHKRTLQTFMEIRNQFMHNMEADTYVKCISFTEHEKYLLKNYPAPGKDLTLEKQLEYAVKELGKAVIELLTDLWDKVHIKIMNDAETAVAVSVKDALQKTMEQIEGKLEGFFNEELDNNTTFDKKRFQKLTPKIKELIYNLLKDNW